MISIDDINHVRAAHMCKCAWNNAATGAVSGAGLGLLLQMLRPKDPDQNSLKEYLISMISGAGLGSAAGWAVDNWKHNQYKPKKPDTQKKEEEQRKALSTFHVPTDEDYQAEAAIDKQNGRNVRPGTHLETINTGFLQRTPGDVGQVGDPDTPEARAAFEKKHPGQKADKNNTAYVDELNKEVQEKNKHRHPTWQPPDAKTKAELESLVAAIRKNGAAEHQMMYSDLLDASGQDADLFDDKGEPIQNTVFILQPKYLKAWTSGPGGGNMRDRLTPHLGEPVYFNSQGFWPVYVSDDGMMIPITESLGEEYGDPRLYKLTGGHIYANTNRAVDAGTKLVRDISNFVTNGAGNAASDFSGRLIPSFD
jgi:hypothetical protein